MHKTLTAFSSFVFIPALLWLGIMFLFTIATGILSKLGVTQEELYYENVDAIGWIALPFCIIFGMKWHYDYIRADKTSRQQDEANNQEFLNTRLREYTESIEVYKPAHEGTYLSRGLIKFSLKDYAGAISDYTKAIELDPNYAEAYYARGFVMHFKQDYLGAITDYTTAIAIYPSHASANYRRGKIKYILEDFKGAVIDYTKAIEVDRHYEKAYKDRGVAKYRLRNYLGSIADFTRSIDPNHLAIRLEKEQKFNNIFNR
jgi:tetratricopeptide (TPR) repeat protein